MESSGSENHQNPPDKNADKPTATQLKKLKEKKEKLRKDIQELEALNFQIKCCLNIPKFGDIKHLLKSSASVLGETSTKVPDVESEYMDELFKLGGMHCTKFVENEHVFSFSSGNPLKIDAYAVQITNASEKPAIGKWVMPMSIDMNSLLLETPLETTMDLKAFLANCKHHIDCYTNRVQQYDELQLIMANLSNCWLDSRLGHTVITLKFFYMQDVDSEVSYNIMLYLIYESNRVRPHKIKIDPLNCKTLADPMVSKFKAYFKYFKCHDLKKAFEETVAARDTPVVWQGGKDEDVLDLNDSSSSGSEADFLTKGRKNRKTSTSRGKKRTAKDASLRSNESADREQSSDDSDSSLLDSVTERIQESVKNKGKRPAPKKKITKVAESSKTKSKPKNIQKKNVGPSAKTSKTNLRQKTLEFQSERPRRADPEQLDSDATPLSARISSAPGPSTSKRGSKSNVTQLENRDFGTSTPVPHLSRQKKRFEAPDKTLLSPIRSKSAK